MPPSDDYNALFLQSIQQRDWLLAFVVVIVAAAAINVLAITHFAPKTKGAVWLIIFGGFYATLAMAYLTVR